MRRLSMWRRQHAKVIQRAQVVIQRQTYHIGTRHRPERPSMANRSASQGRIKTFPRPQIPWQFPESLFTPRPHAPPPHTDRRYSANGRSHVLATRLVLLSPAQPCDPRAWRLDQKPRAAREDRRTQVGCSALLCSSLVARLLSSFLYEFMFPVRSLLGDRFSGDNRPLGCALRSPQAGEECRRPSAAGVMLLFVALWTVAWACYFRERRTS